MEEMINEKFKDLTTVTIKVTIPIRIWEEWNKDCEMNFNGTRFLKMKFDNDFRKQFAPLSEMIIDDLEQMKERVSLLEEMIYNNKTAHVRKTLDGKVIER